MASTGAQLSLQLLYVDAKEGAEYPGPDSAEQTACVQVLAYSVSNMRARFEFLHGLGLTRKEAAAILARCPTVLGLSVDANLWPKVEYLTKGLKGTADSLVSCPAYLTLSLQHRYSSA